VKRLARPLTVVLGVLIALSGGTFVLLRVRAGGTSATAAATRGASAPLDAGTTGLGTTTTGATTTSPPAPTTTRPPTPAPTGTVVPPGSPAALFSTLNAAVAGTNSCLLVEDGLGRVLYQHQPDTPLIPASTQKLLVAEAALATLGPNYRFTTSVVAAAAPVNGQVATLWLVGDGDPLLATPEFTASNASRARVAGYPWTPLATLADRLAATGVKAVTGGIRGDDSYEDQLRFLPVWPPLYQQQQQIGLLSALSVNEGIQFPSPKPTLAGDPPGYAASELARLLGLRNVVAAGQSDATAPPRTVVLASVTSAPLSQIVEAMLRASDNWIAELLTRAVDKASGGTGTTAGGVAAVLHNASAAGIPMTGSHMDDGSGLSRSDRATCRELLAALDVSAQSVYGPVLAGLPVAGQSGTLAARYRTAPIVGKLRAKTGSLDGVGGMVGVMTVAPTLHFAFVENDAVTETVLFARQDAVVAGLAAYRG
jgi:D-alanyl-D-alanine carboxypeptidase/D-alanyl-D-alanine-endopeptidase (penicillin-binding protein 4)